MGHTHAALRGIRPEHLVALVAEQPPEQPRLRAVMGGREKGSGPPQSRSCSSLASHKTRKCWLHNITKELSSVVEFQLTFIPYPQLQEVEQNLPGAFEDNYK
jgi:hypothetical protein